LRSLDPSLDPDSAFAALRRPGEPSLLFDGRGGYDGAWPCRFAVEPRLSLTVPPGAPDPKHALAHIDAFVARRRAAGGPGGTGVAVLVAYEAFAPASAPRDLPWDVLAIECDAAIAFPAGAAPLAIGNANTIARAIAKLDQRDARAAGVPPPAHVTGPPRTSLPRDAYLSAVTRVKRHIAEGDIYQGNLTQRFEAQFESDPWALYRALAAATPAPRSAYVELPGFALASVSPEMFVDVDPGGRAETRPIKGTRPRRAAAEDDAEEAAQLLASPKDHAELVMIVDVLRNDLGRLAATGSVSVPELATLRSYPAVHHLVARVVAQLPAALAPSEILAAIFPGGSITGAPKERAIELLRTLEPCPRGLYTGSLVWFDDDGSMASSILIRSAVVSGNRVSIGAGGGIVADSDPEAEWSEANAKARALTRALGFEPEEAG